MNTNIETFTLKKAVFTVEMPTLSSVVEMLSELSAEQMLALCENAASQWAYRKAAKETNHGKAFTFLEMVNDMMAVRQREGKPSKEDIGFAEQAFVVIKNDIARREDIEDHTDPAYWPAVWEGIEAHANKARAKFPGLSWSAPEALEAQEAVPANGKQKAIPAVPAESENAHALRGLALLQRAARLARERQQKAANPLL